MPDYKAMYFELFRASVQAVQLLQDAQAHAEQQDAAVVHERHERGNRELMTDVKNGGKTGSGQEEHLRRKHDAQKVGQSCALLGSKARSHHRSQSGRRRKGQHGKRAYGERGPGEHRAEESPAVGLVLFKAPGKQRYERDGNVSAREKIVQKIRHHEGREINVRLSPGAELPGDDLVAEKTHEPRDKNTERHDEGGRTHFLP